MMTMSARKCSVLLNVVKAIYSWLVIAPTIRISVLTYGALQMQTTYLLTYLFIALVLINDDAVRYLDV